MLSDRRESRFRSLSSQSSRSRINSAGDEVEFDLFDIESVPAEDFVASKLQFLNRLNCCGLDDSVFVLSTLFTATTTFTVAQLIGAVKANSLAMYGDCATMALDALTYLLNIYCEKRRIAGTKEAIRLEVMVASISVAALTFVTIWLLWDSIQRLRSGHQPEENVDASIMLKFSSINFIIDIFSCAVFLSKFKETQITSPKKSSKKYAPIGSRDSVFKSFNSIEITPQEDTNLLAPRNLNMASAFLHLAADTLRTLTVMITATVVDVDPTDVDSVDADAIGSIVVCVIILAVVVALCFELIGLTMSLKSWGNETTSSDDDDENIDNN